MNTENPNTNDLHDRMLDHALRETFGGEAPPNLTQQILTAADEQSSQLSTLAIGDEAMNGNHEKTQTARKRWAVLAVAASLLVAAGLILPSFQSARESTRLTEGVANNTRELKPISGDKLQMMVEPQMIVETSESETLGIESIDNIGLEGLINDGYAATPEERAVAESSPSSDESAPQGAGYGGQAPEFSVDIDTPGRKYSFGFERPNLSEVKPNQRTANQSDSLQRTRKKEESVDLKAPQSIPAPVTAESVVGKKPGSTVSAMGRSRKRDLPVIPGGSVPFETMFGKSETVKIDHFYADSREGDRSSGLNSQGMSLKLAKRLRLHRVPGIIIADEGEERLGVVPDQTQQGSGPGTSGDQYTRIYENPFITAEGEAAVSTFSIDVDTASYANVRQFLMQSRTLPPPDAVRIEELVNYFDYDYSGPTGEIPFAAHVEIAGCPWHPEHRLLRVGIKGREVELENRPQSNLVFLIDVSGSMNEQAKLPLLVNGLKLLTHELGENDRVAIVVYASSEGLALDSTRGDQQDTILAALEKLRAGGSTAGGAGIQLAYQIAEDHFIEGGTNRVILATDGDFNVGTTSTAELERLAELKAKQTGVFLTVLGFGRGNLNDAMMEAISGKGNGNYHYIDNQKEARKVLVEEMTGTLLTIAKDVKIQIEFNPAQVAGYRLIGYENRMLRTEDFNDDKKDAGEIGAGHTVTALYEIVPAGKPVAAGAVDALKYQTPAKSQTENSSDDLLTLKIRYKQPDGDTSSKLEFPITDAGQPFAEATDDFKFAAAVASFGMLLRDSEHRGSTSLDAVLEIAESTLNHPVSGRELDPHGYRAEFLQLVRQAKELKGE